MSVINFAEPVVVKGEKLKKIIPIPIRLLDQDFEIRVKPKRKKTFSSFQKIKLDTKNFKFDREDANAR